MRAFILSLLVFGGGRALAGESQPPVDFTQQIRPLLARHCLPCHGPDQERRKAGLRFDNRESAFADHDGTRAFVAGKPAASEAYRRMVTSDPDDRMPPVKTGQGLTAREAALVKSWIEAGAPWEEHWAFQPVVRPPVPSSAFADQAKNPIDAFVHQRLAKEGMTPSPQADPYTLARRVALDLTGLPPPPEMVTTFAGNPTDAAYEAMVNRLLASPAYGERWARVWLDLARYADSKGYEKDRQRTIWRYRDWLIAALNRDLPYNDFTVQQLAGDLLPDRTADTLLATAFHRNTLTNDEGGTDDEEFRVAAVKDRVDTTMQVWMGLTMGCAKCHDHKYDPISMRDYYRFYAFFNQTEDSDKPSDEPREAMPTAEQQTARERLQLQVDRANAALAVRAKRIDLAGWVANWVRQEGAAYRKGEWQPAQLGPWKTMPGGQDGPHLDEVMTAPLAEAMLTPRSRRTTLQRRLIRDALLRRLDFGAADLLAQRDRLSEEQERLVATFPRIPIMRDLPEAKRRTTWLQPRGNFLDKGAVVDPGTPEAFPALPPAAPRNRLGMARWIADSQNPLTTRVAVNRQWAQLFGAGLVETEEDFGTQGSPPTHRELLDWLASDLVRQGWSLKKITKTMVMSATYRQSAVTSAALARRDRFNRLYARGPRFRLEAEMVRDQSLAVAGLLSLKMYGPSVMPPQPEGIWSAVYNGDRWVTPDNGDRWRRGLYTFVRRSSPYPSATTFDAPSREVCSVRRIRSNTPLQALVTLNDPVFVEAAQALALRFLQKPGSSRDQIASALQWALARPGRAEEIDRLVDLLTRREAHYRSHPDQARAMASNPHLSFPDGMDLATAAAATNVANVILNLDEFLTKG